MKTVIDAVNEFEGIAPTPCHAENKNQVIMAVINFDGYLVGDLTTGDGVRNNEFWKVICTREEFNQCVEEMSKAEWIKPVTSLTYQIGDKVTLVEDTKLYSCHYDVVYDLSAGDAVAVVGNGVRPDNNAPLVTITNGKGFATLNPDYIAPPIELIDGKAYQFDYHGRVEQVGIYNKKSNHFSLYAMNNHADSCTNIQLLEVKS